MNRKRMYAIASSSITTNDVGQGERGAELRQEKRKGMTHPADRRSKTGYHEGIVRFAGHRRGCEQRGQCGHRAVHETKKPRPNNVQNEPPLLFGRSPCCGHVDLLMTGWPVRPGNQACRSGVLWAVISTV